MPIKNNFVFFFLLLFRQFDEQKHIIFPLKNEEPDEGRAAKLGRFFFERKVNRLRREPKENKRVSTSG